MKSLDVRNIAPCNRHSLIFQMFDELNEGESFELINDHDPKPLYYQFLHERPNQFVWDYLERGSDVWRVSIQRQTGEGAE